MTYKNKEDAKAYARGHYQKHKELYKARARESKVSQVQKNKQWLLDYLKTHPCVDCGETDVEVLEFDHIKMIGSKAKRIGAYINSFGRLKEEVAKCEIRCANCHTRRTRKQLGWWRDDSNM
jgi:hypothetical protein